MIDRPVPRHLLPAGWYLRRDNYVVELVRPPTRRSGGLLGLLKRSLLP